MPSLSRTDLLRLARSGAEARVTELRRELETIYRSFPDLRRRGGGRASARGNGAAPRGRASRGSRKRRGWTAAQRRAVAERMKRYWAARRAGQKK